MTITTLKDLDKLISLCRKRGVDRIKVDNIELQLSDIPLKVVKPRGKFVSEPTYAPGGVMPDTKIEMPDQLTDEQLLMWSAGATGDTI